MAIPNGKGELLEIVKERILTGIVPYLVPCISRGMDELPFFGFLLHVDGTISYNKRGVGWAKSTPL